MKGRQGERVRLYVRGTVLGYKRSKSNQYPNTSLIQIEGVNTTGEVAWYKGKRLAYIYKAKTKKNGSHYRCIWGKVTRPHGNSGVVRSKFTSNLPPKSMGARVRVFMTSHSGTPLSAPPAKSLKVNIKRILPNLRYSSIHLLDHLFFLLVIALIVTQILHFRYTDESFTFVGGGSDLGRSQLKERRRRR
ncbi:unnamed protein product [Microthlaspi erraticum]|uniref:60S ribosomal protein L35a n=1 Tax=Microthlaspi erraticum TaxID=1685480 RepID=A0A6D2L7I4_9BRAS|nr:unnamed protein product [Microthlaspi erraticum]